MSEIILDSVIDSIKLLPFLFLTYLFMEWLEHKTGAAARKRIRTAGKFGPVWGGLLGVIPQCGFSAAASSLFAGRVITVGTLIAVYLSTSDEMFPIMISNAVPVVTIVKILTCKAVIGILSGLVLEYVYTHILKKQEPDVDIHEICEEERCHCEHGVISSAAFHTLKVFVYIFLISLVLNIIIGLVGEETLAGLFTGTPIAGELIAALVGLIPNCASSVVITQLYLDHIIGAGAMMAGLLVNAGVGLLILFRLNRDRVQNLKIVGVLYGLFAAVQPLHSFAESKIFNPAFFFVFFVTDLIHDIESISSFGIHRLKKAHRALDRIHGIDDHFLVNADLISDLRDGRLFEMLPHIVFPGVDGFVGNIPQRAADPYAVVIPEISSDLTDDHRNCIGRKLYLKGGIKIIDCFDQADTADLKEIVGVFTAVGEALDHA